MLLIVTISGCDKIKGLIEEKVAETWPPIDEVALRKQVELRLQEQLATVPNPNAYAIIPADIIKPLLQTQLSSIKGLSNSSVELQDDAIFATTDFELTDSNSKDEANGLNDLKNYNISGNLKVAVTPILDLTHKKMRFLFAFDVIKITKADVQGHRIPDAVANTFTKLLIRYLANINGVLNTECTKPADQQTVKVPSCLTIFPSTIANSLDLKKSLQESPSTISVSAETVNLSLEIKGAAIAVSKQGVYLIAQLAGVAFGSGDEPIPPAQPENISATTAREKVVREATDILGAEQNKDILVGTKTSLLARAIGYITAASQLSFTAGIDMPPETFCTDVRLAKKPEFECSRIECSQQHCEKPNCHKTERPCIDDGGDFAGLINKICTESVNLVCEGGRAATDLICNTVQVLGKASCDVGEELKKAGCEGNKIFVDKVMGSIGMVSGDYRVNGTYSVTLDNANVRPDLSIIDLTVTAKTSVKANGSLKFIPKNHGHFLACIAQWKEGFSVDVSIPESRRSLTATNTGTEFVEGNGLVIKYAVAPLELSGRVTPSPFDAVFNQHPHLRLNCLLPSAIGDLAKFVKIIDPETNILPDELNQAVTGQVTKKVDNITLDANIPTYETTLFENNITMKPAIKTGFIVYSGSL